MKNCVIFAGQPAGQKNASKIDKEREREREREKKKKWRGKEREREREMARKRERERERDGAEKRERTSLWFDILPLFWLKSFLLVSSFSYSLLRRCKIFSLCSSLKMLTIHTLACSCVKNRGFE